MIFSENRYPLFGIMLQGANTWRRLVTMSIESAGEVWVMPKPDVSAV
jgi:hypothetical protein